MHSRRLGKESSNPNFDVQIIPEPTHTVANIKATLLTLATEKSNVGGQAPLRRAGSTDTLNNAQEKGNKLQQFMNNLPGAKVKPEVKIEKDEDNVKEDKSVDQKDKDVKTEAELINKLPGVINVTK